MHLERAYCVWSILWLYTAHLTCKNYEVPFKNEVARVFTTDLSCKSMHVFPDAQGQLTPQSEVGSA